MRQAVMTAPGKIEFRDVAVPVPAKGEVLIRMMKIGVCGSDIHVYHGKHPYTSYPIVQGHEIAGVVEKVGEGVNGFAKGDAVTLQPQVTLRHLLPLPDRGLSHLRQLKVMGFQTPVARPPILRGRGFQGAEAARRDEPREAAMVEPLSVGVHALASAGAARPERSLVMGPAPSATWSPRLPREPAPTVGDGRRRQRLGGSTWQGAAGSRCRPTRPRWTWPRP